MLDSGEGRTVAGEDEVRRTVLRFAFAFMAFVAALGIATVVARWDDGGGGVVVGARRAESGAEAVGPARGTALPPYERARSAALRDVEGSHAAVVSLTRYRTEADARAVVRPARVHALLVAAPGGAATVVTGDLASWATRERRRAAAERDALERLLPTVDDPDFVREYRAQAERLRRVEAALDASGTLVFGVLVEAEAEVLRDLARSTSVRLVDVAVTGRVSVPDARGLRPEETAVAGQPPTRP